MVWSKGIAAFNRTVFLVQPGQYNLEEGGVAFAWSFPIGVDSGAHSYTENFGDPALFWRRNCTELVYRTEGAYWKTVGAWMQVHNHGLEPGVFSIEHQSPN